MCLHSQHNVSWSKHRHSFSLMVLFLVLWCSCLPGFLACIHLCSFLLIVSVSGFVSLHWCCHCLPHPGLCLLNLLFLVCLSLVAYLCLSVCCVFMFLVRLVLCLPSVFAPVCWTFYFASTIFIFILYYIYFLLNLSACYIPVFFVSDTSNWQRQREANRLKYTRRGRLTRHRWIQSGRGRQ